MGRVIWQVYGEGSFHRCLFFLILTSDSLLLIYMLGQCFTIQFLPMVGSPFPARWTKESLVDHPYHC